MQQLHLLTNQRVVHHLQHTLVHLCSIRSLALGELEYDTLHAREEMRLIHLRLFDAVIIMTHLVCRHHDAYMFHEAVFLLVSLLHEFRSLIERIKLLQRRTCPELSIFEWINHTAKHVKLVAEQLQ